MKRLLQVAATGVIAVLALQPAPVGLACTLQMPASGTACPMGMTEMTPDCPMAQQMADAGCMQQCCNHGLPRIAAPALTLVKPRSGGAAAVMARIPVVPETALATPSLSWQTADSGPPPRYLLNRVFRI